LEGRWHHLSLKEKPGTVAINEVNAKGLGTSEIWRGDWSDDWSHLRVFTVEKIKRMRSHLTCCIAICGALLGFFGCSSLTYQTRFPQHINPKGLILEDSGEFTVLADSGVHDRHTKRGTAVALFKKREIYSIVRYSVGTGDQIFKDFDVLPDGTFLILGTHPTAESRKSAWLLQVDENGTILRESNLDDLYLKEVIDPAAHGRSRKGPAYRDCA
jgi:hypothetical protein